jgi:hypothetical protein
LHFSADEHLRIEEILVATRDIFQRELAGEVIPLSDPEYPKIAALITEAQRIIAKMNTGC